MVAGDKEGIGAREAEVEEEGVEDVVEGFDFFRLFQSVMFFKSIFMAGEVAEADEIEEEEEESEGGECTEGSGGGGRVIGSSKSGNSLLPLSSPPPPVFLVFFPLFGHVSALGLWLVRM